MSVTGLKSVIGGVLGRAIYARPPSSKFWKDRALVTVFHSINDNAKSDIACTTRQFRDYLDFFCDHFDVISMSELADRLANRQDISHKLVVTFDDGYLDNFEIGAPELSKRGMPASFYLATSFIGSKLVPWWDAEVNIESKWMGWDHVRQMHAAGFEIGAHTHNHVDLGRVSAEEAREELVTCGDLIEANVGTRPDALVYPFGQPRHINQRSRDVAKSLGIRVCAGCSGGVVTPDTDPMQMPRLGISPWYLSAPQYGFDAWRTSRR